MTNLNHQQDDLVQSIIDKELKRQQNQIELIASENIVSPAILKACGSILTNKYAEGYPSKRYYGGCEVVDEVEQLAIDSAKELFKCKYANVQPHSGSQANFAVYFALLSPGDTVLGMDLSAGGHLTHGSKVSFSGKWFNAVSYGVEDNGMLNYEELKEKLYEHNPKMLIVGGSAYSRFIDFARIKGILDEYNADKPKTKYEEQVEIEARTVYSTEVTIDKCYYMVDMAHFAGLVAGGVYQSPLEYADVVTSTTHKTLRGPRGGIILTNNEDISKKIDKSVFPGIQGGPLEHIIAAKAICFREALQPDFKDYALQITTNCSTLAETLKSHGISIISGGTDTHLLLVNLMELGISGKLAEETLEKAGLTCNKNSVPNDVLSPKLTSGIRLGTAAGTTRGFKQEEFKEIGNLIAGVLKKLSFFENNKDKNANYEQVEYIIDFTKKEVDKLCEKFPIYKGL